MLQRLGQPRWAGLFDAPEDLLLLDARVTLAGWRHQVSTLGAPLLASV